jgi:restriction system protein
VARRSSFSALIAQRQRELQRQVRARERLALAERARREYARSAAQGEIERKRLYVASRQADALEAGAKLDEANLALETLLGATLDVDDFLDLELLKERPQLPPFEPGVLSTAEVRPTAKRRATSPCLSARAACTNSAGS